MSLGVLLSNFLITRALQSSLFILLTEKKNSFHIVFLEMTIAKQSLFTAGDCGDHVVVINTKHIAFSGNKWEQKVYSSHTG